MKISDYSKKLSVMNELEDTFNQIATIHFLSDALQKAIDEDDAATIIDTADAIHSFLPVFQSVFKNKIKKIRKEVLNREKMASPVVNGTKVNSYINYDEILKYHESKNLLAQDT